MLLPAVTGFGLAELVILRSASVLVATPVVTVAVLLAVLVSWLVVATVTVSVMSVPPVTFTTTGNVLVVPGAKLGSLQLMEPVVVQVQPAGTGVSETNVVLAGNASVKLAVEQLLGPLLVTTCV
jgi:hypothetical protein